MQQSPPASAQQQIAQIAFALYIPKIHLTSTQKPVTVFGYAHSLLLVPKDVENAFSAAVKLTCNSEDDEW
jgi:hypothetical protein